jgi:F-type H+-transporting ATPase subunit c
MKKQNLALIGVSLLPAAAMAQEGAAAAGTNTSTAFLAAGICMGVAAGLCGIGQGFAASSALDGIGRNPTAGKSLLTPLLLSLAFIESLSLFAFVIAIMLATK